MNVSEIELAIRKLKQKFVRDVARVGNQSDTKIEIAIKQRPENVFFRDGERPPFDIIINELPANVRSTTPCIFGR